MFGTALVDAVGPALLIGWSEVGPWMLRQIHAVCPPVTLRQPEAKPDPEPLVLPARLLARTRELDSEHRAATGRPISRDTLRAGCGSAGTGPAPGRRRPCRGSRGS